MGLKCIIIDDSLFIRETVKSIIESSGHDVIALFENGPSFLNTIYKYDPDIIFCDIILPEMTGLDLLPLISEGFPFAKTIMLSGVTQGEAISAALRLGAIDFIQKPVDKDRLISLLDKLASSTTVPSVEELSLIGVGCTILNGFFEELTAHASTTLLLVIDQQIKSIMSDVHEMAEGMFKIDLATRQIEPDPDLWGKYTEEDVIQDLKKIPEELRFELEFLYETDFISNLFHQAIMTLSSKSRYSQLFGKVPPEMVGLPPLPELKSPSDTIVSKAGTTHEELKSSISVALFVFDKMGPNIVESLNEDLIPGHELMKNSIFYYSLIGEEGAYYRRHPLEGQTVQKLAERRQWFSLNRLCVHKLIKDNLLEVRPSGRVANSEMFLD